MNTDWKIYFERGKVDEQIRDLSNRFYNYKDKILKQINLDSTTVFNQEKTGFNSEFEGFLTTFFNKIQEFNPTNYKQEIYETAYDLFKKRLNSNLIKQLNEKIICDLAFNDAYSFYKLIEAFKIINTTLTFRINPTIIQVYTPNESKTCLMQVVFKVKNCQIYTNEQLEISIKLDDIITYLKCRKTDLNHVQLIFKEDKLDLEIYSKRTKSKIKRTLKIIDIELANDGILDELLELKHNNSFELNVDNFNYLLSQSGRISEAVKLILNNNSIIFSEENSIGEGNIEWSSDIISNINLSKDDIKIYFSIEYFNIFAGFLSESNPIMKINIEKDIPIKIQVNFKNLDETYGHFFIAQRDPF